MIKIRLSLSVYFLYSSFICSVSITIAPTSCPGLTTCNHTDILLHYVSCMFSCCIPFRVSECDFSCEIFFSFIFHCFSISVPFQFLQIFPFQFQFLAFFSFSQFPFLFQLCTHFSLKSKLSLMLGLMFGMHVVLFVHCKLLLHSHC